MNKNPKFSILCPAYNHERFVKHFIKSVLNQSDKDFELIIVDDCSVDKTVEEISKFSDPRIKFIKHEYNKGINASLNDAFNESSGEYCVFIASDDVLEPNHFEISGSYLDKNPDVGVFYSSLSLIDENGSPIPDLNNLYLRNNNDRFGLLKTMFFNGNILLSPGMVIRRNAMQQIMPLELAIIQYQDYQMHIKLLLNNEIHQSEHKLVQYRQMSDNANISARTEVVAKREELEEFKLMDTYLEIKDLELLRKIFPQEIAQVGEPTADTIPYFLGTLAFFSPKEIRKNWGYHTIMNFLNKPENFEMLHKHYKMDFKSYLNLVNYLDTTNRYDVCGTLLAHIRQQQGEKK